MPLRAERNIWTYLIVTAVTLVVWFLAASETRDRRTINAAVSLRVEADSPWIVSPATGRVAISAEGTRLALDRAQEVVHRGLTLDLPAVRGSDRIGLLDLLRKHPDLISTGVNIESVDPPGFVVERDEIVIATARVRASLPGVQTGEITFEPPEVEVSLPAAMRDRAVGELTVEAFLDRAQLERLPPDVRHEQEAKLRLSEAAVALMGGSAANVAISPGTVRIGFTIRSRVRQTMLDLVRVQLQQPPEDNKEYLVEFEDEVIRNVTVTAEADIVRRIEAGEVRVFAVLHLESSEKEQRITSKPISHFVAFVPDQEGGARGVFVEARVGDSQAPPVVRFRVDRMDHQ